MIALEIAKKNFIEFFRNFKSTAIVVVMPLVMLAIFGFIFKGDTSTIQFDIGYVENDSQQYKVIIEALRELKNQDQEISLFIIHPFSDLESAKESVIETNNTLIVTWEEPEGIAIIGDQRNPYFVAAAGVITNVANNILEVKESKVRQQPLSLDDSKKLTPYDLLVPGLMIYGLLILIPYVAGLVTDIREKGYLLRFYLSKASSFDIILGYTLTLMALAFVQTLLLFYVAQLLGFEPVGSVFAAILIAIPTNLFIVGTGLLIGSFVKDGNNATNVGSIAAVILGFMSGSFIVGIETITKIGEIAGRSISFNQIFATSFATQALTQVLLYDKALTDIKFELIALTISSLVVLAAGIYFFNKLQLQRLD